MRFQVEQGEGDLAPTRVGQFTIQTRAAVFKEGREEGILVGKAGIIQHVQLGKAFLEDGQPGGQGHDVVVS